MANPSDDVRRKRRLQRDDPLCHEFCFFESVELQPCALRGQRAVRAAQPVRPVVRPGIVIHVDYGWRRLRPLSRWTQTSP